MDNNELRKHLKEQIEECCEWCASFTNAVDVEKIPYITFGVKELLSEDYGRHVMELTVDAWDKETPFDVIAKIDKLDRYFRKYKAITDKFVVQVFLGNNRQFIEDEDKNIKRLQRKYDLIVHEKGE